jgi:predicted amidophosphoribosyltransferase
MNQANPDLGEKEYSRWPATGGPHLCPHCKKRITSNTLCDNCSGDSEEYEESDSD